MNDSIVGLDGISKRYEAVEAIRNVSLIVRRGEFVSLLGPSGCGKSTMLRMIAGFEHPDQGTITVDGVDVIGVTPNRRPVNMVFQNYALFPHLTVADNIAFGLRRKRVPKDEVAKRVERFLGLVGLEGLGNRYSSQLSGGQQQRVALARALVNQPKVLLLDEPLGALDLKLRKRMQVELKHLQREIGISFIYVTHDQDEALALSDRIAVMNQGVVLQYGPGRQIYDFPKTEFVANFLGEANVLRGTILQTGQMAVVDVAGEHLIVPDANGVAPHVGDEALVVVRPEHLVFDTRDQQIENRLSCRVDDKIFQGNSFLVYLRLSNDSTAIVRGVDRQIFDSLSLGGIVRIGWRTDMARLVSP
jgi:spermidine/putrescine transport system ATP-binding protein